ncbi:50S ribosomal protein L4, partial [Patescibacteria group bacterium]|nr:50S ribosomal protein L4 [Patescibacteria group bacterium]
ADLNPVIFGVKVKPALVHEAMVAQQANARKNVGHTKTRGEVRGGGKKPWKQKGTGRARQGSIRSPQWVGGGIAHGPRKERNFSLKINAKVKRQAFLMALSDKVAHEKLVLLEKPVFTEEKTKQAALMFKKLPLGRRTLFVIPSSNPGLLRMVRNIPNVHLVTANTLNLVDVLTAPSVLMQQEVLPVLEKTYGTI